MLYWESVAGAPSQSGQEVSSVNSEFFSRLRPCMLVPEDPDTGGAGHDSGTTSAQVAHRCSSFVYRQAQ